MFLIDGLQAATVSTAVANGATNIKFLIDNGVTAQSVYTTSPAATAQLPDGTLPWDNATSGHVAARVRLIRLHLQRIRDFWGGPASETTPTSPYIQHLVEAPSLHRKVLEHWHLHGLWYRVRGLPRGNARDSRTKRGILLSCCYGFARAASSPLVVFAAAS